MWIIDAHNPFPGVTSMGRAEETEFLNRPRIDVFEFILDAKSNPLWRPSVADIAKMPRSPSALEPPSGKA